MKKLFYNGEIITVDSKNSVHQAMMIEGNKITFVGSTQQTLGLIDDQTEMVDLCGCSVLPGFIDCHIHMAVAESKPSEQLDLSKEKGVRTVGDALNIIKNAAKEKSDGGWILCGNYNHEELEEKRHITAEELEKAAPNVPVMIVHKSGHMSVSSRKAMEYAKEQGVVFPTEHKILDKDGNPTGLLKESAHFMMLAKSPFVPNDEKLVEGIERFCKKLLKAGITGCHDAGGYENVTYRSLQRAKNEGKLENRVYTMLWTLFGKEAQKENFKTQMDAGFFTGFGDEWLKKGPLKIMVDGSAVGGTCATTTPILSKNEIFPPTFSQSELDEIFITAHRSGFQLTAHAAGDKAIEMVLNSYEKAIKDCPRPDPRHRIEHCFLCSEGLMKRIKALGVIPIPNPAFLSVWGEVFEKYYGNRIGDVIPLKGFLDNGITMAFGSDAMVIDRFEPLFGIAAAMDRRDLNSGRVIGKGMEIGFMEALRGYTINAAYSSFEEKVKGSLEVGKLADFVVLSDKVMHKTPEELRKITVASTYLDGVQTGL